MSPRERRTNTVNSLQINLRTQESLMVIVTRQGHTRHDRMESK